jgi:hypothetical protein
MRYEFTSHKIKLFDTIYKGGDFYFLSIPKNGTTTINGTLKGSKYRNLSRMPKGHYNFKTFVRSPIDRFWSGMCTAFYGLLQQNRPDHVMRFITDWLFVDQHLLPQTLFLENCYKYCPDSHIEFHHISELSKILKTDNRSNKTKDIHLEKMKEWVLEICPEIEGKIKEMYSNDFKLNELIGKTLHFDELWEYLDGTEYGTIYHDNLYKEVGELVLEWTQDKAVLRVAKAFPEFLPKIPDRLLYRKQTTKRVKMAGIVFWFQSQDRDVFSSRPIDLDAWRYAAKAGGIDQARCINETPWPIFFDGDFDFEIIGSRRDDFMEWSKDKTNMVILETERQCPEGAIPLRELDHSKVEWYIFGNGNASPQGVDGQYVYLPQDGIGGLHPVHTASAVLLRRWEELTKEG